MADGRTIEGVVVDSEVKKPSHPNLLTTKIRVLLEDGMRIPYAGFSGRGPHEINLRGRHVLGGKRIRASYHYHTGVLWAESYELFNEDGEVIHSDNSFSD